jgi:type II secretory pathway pseudopilin PulG
MLSLAIVGILTAVSLPVLGRLQTKNNLDSAVVTFVQAVRRAQILAQSVSGDDSWGVNVGSGAITLFKGTGFVSRDTAYDETFTVPSTISVSGLSEIVMAKFTGYPSATGSISLTSTVTPSDTATVTINSRGMVSY